MQLEVVKAAGGFAARQPGGPSDFICQCFCCHFAVPVPTLLPVIAPCGHLAVIAPCGHFSDGLPYFRSSRLFPNSIDLEGSYMFLRAFLINIMGRRVSPIPPAGSPRHPHPSPKTFCRCIRTRTPIRLTLPIRPQQCFVISFKDYAFGIFLTVPQWRPCNAGLQKFPTPPCRQEVILFITVQSRPV